MAAQLFQLPRTLAISSSFQPLPGAKLYFYLSGTTTPQDTFQDAELDEAHQNPVVADSNGFFPEIYQDPAISYKCELRTSGDVLLYTSDPCNSAFPSSGQVNIASSVSGTNTIVAALVPAITVYTPEMTLVLTPVATNTSSVTIDVGAGALPAQYLDGSALSGSEMLIDRPALFNLNKAGTAWVLQNPAVLKSRGREVGTRGLTSNLQNGNYTLVATDYEKDIRYGGSGGHTITLPNSIFSTADVAEISNAGSGTVTIAATGTLFWFGGAGSFPSGSRTLAIGGACRVRATSGTSWEITGVGIT